MKKVLEKIKTIIDVFFSTEMTIYSANAAFFLVISSIPIFMLLFSTISLIPNVQIEDLINNINLLFPNLPYVRRVLEYIMSVARGLATKNVISINIVTAIVTGSTALYSFSIGIRKIHNITRKSSYLSLRILAFFNMFVFFMAIIIMLIAFIMGSMILGYVKKYIPFAEDVLDKVFSYKYFVAFIILFVMTISLYTTSTNFERRLKHNFLGALISTFLWLVVSNLFSLYFKNFPLDASLYGSLAGIVVVLLWLYLCISIIFIGAVVNEVFIPERTVLEERKKMIMEELEKGNDDVVDKIINDITNSKQ